MYLDQFRKLCYEILSPEYGRESQTDPLRRQVLLEEQNLCRKEHGSINENIERRKLVYRPSSAAST